MTQNLLSIEKFIDLGRRNGAGFGEGDPKIHLAYLTRLGILPQTVKRKINGEMTGCYPENAINIVLKVEQMKSKGMTYSQIAKLLSVIPANAGIQLAGRQPHLMTADELDARLRGHDAIEMSHAKNLISNPSFLYLIIGLLFGFLLSTLNSQGLAQMQKQANVSSGEAQSQTELVKINSQSVGIPNDVYVVSIPKQNLDKLEKTNINYLISN